MSTAQFAPPAPRSVPATGRSRLPAVVLVAALVLVGVVGRWAIVEQHDRSPYPPWAVDAHVSVSIVKAGQARATLDRLAGPGRLGLPLLVKGEAQQVIVGELTFRTPPRLFGGHGGEYALFVLDRWDSSRPVSTMWGIGPIGTNVGQGWEGDYDNIAHKYDWLATLASPRLPDGSYGSAGMAVVFAATTRGPVTFTAKLREPTEITGDPARRITVVLAFLGDGGHVYWADRLYG